VRPQTFRHGLAFRRVLSNALAVSSSSRTGRSSSGDGGVSWLSCGPLILDPRPAGLTGGSPAHPNVWIDRRRAAVIPTAMRNAQWRAIDRRRENETGSVNKDSCGVTRAAARMIVIVGFQSPECGASAFAACSPARLPENTQSASAKPLM
jgi:hypothetical protein